MWMPLILCFHRWIELLEEIPKLLVPGLVSFQVQCPRLIRQGKLVWKLIFVFGGAGTLLYTASILVPASNEIPGFIAGLLQQCYCSCIPELMYSSTTYMRKCVKTFSDSFACTCTSVVLFNFFRRLILQGMNREKVCYCYLKLYRTFCIFF